jgi:hypothetical protein
LKSRASYFYSPGGRLEGQARSVFEDMPMETLYDTFDRERCLALWKKQFGHGPPKHASVEFMKKVFLQEAQVRTFGGHSRAVRHVLKECLKEPRNRKAQLGTKSIPSPAALRPGTHLIREWNGRIYKVEITTDGFQMDGKDYRSLTAIARKITGAAWSGPRFFGLAKT